MDRETAGQIDVEHRRRRQLQGHSPLGDGIGGLVLRVWASIARCVDPDLATLANMSAGGPPRRHCCV
eukprot:6920283-Lingulodinium_polyedra.AAC.1